MARHADLPRAHRVRQLDAAMGQGEQRPVVGLDDRVGRRGVAAHDREAAVGDLGAEALITEPQIERRGEVLGEARRFLSGARADLGRAALDAASRTKPTSRASARDSRDCPPVDWEAVCESRPTECLAALSVRSRKRVL